MTTTFAKVGLVFIGGLALGLAVPKGFEPANTSSNSDDGGPPDGRTVTVRCIVEYRGEGASPNRFGGRVVPGPDDDMPVAGPLQRPVEVRVQPNPAKAANGSDEVILIFRLNSCCDRGESANSPPDQPMRDGK